MIDKYHDFLNSKKYTEGTHTDSGNFLCKQTITRPKDYIVIVGSALSTLDDLAERIIKQSIDFLSNDDIGEYKGNDYIFINQGIRALYELEKFRRKDIDKKTLIVFSEGYTSNDILKINEYSALAGANVIYIDNVSELIIFLNNRVKLCRKVEKIEIYAHGLPGSIEFKYISQIDHDPFFIKITGRDGKLDISEISKINKSIFSKSSEWTSYACRTGISSKNESFDQYIDAGQDHSLAQLAANQLGVVFNAYERRSLYSLTYGSKKEIEESRAYVGDNKLLVERRESILIREENEKKGGPIMPKGAWHAPTSGNTPSGLKEGMQRYEPK